MSTAKQAAVYRQALQRLSKEHPERFKELIHDAKHDLGVAHHHETLDHDHETPEGA